MFRFGSQGLAYLFSKFSILNLEKMVFWSYGTLFCSTISPALTLSQPASMLLSLLQMYTLLGGGRVGIGSNWPSFTVPFWFCYFSANLD